MYVMLSVLIVYVSNAECINLLEAGDNLYDQDFISQTTAWSDDKALCI